MRLGIVGCGEVVVKGHLPVLRDLDEFEITALADGSQDQLAMAAKAAGVPAERSFTDYHGLLGLPDLDAVLVATPPSVRPEILQAAGRARLTVISEKPLATTLADADTILANASADQCQIMMCHNYAFFPEFRWLVEQVRAGAIGTVQTVIFQGLGANPWAGVAGYRPGWRNEPRIGGGGRFMDTGLHCLYLMEAVFGRTPDSVWSEVFFDDLDSLVETRCFAHYSFGDGLGIVNIGMGQGPVAVEVVGTKGRLHLEYPTTAGDLAHSPVAGHLVRDGHLVETVELPGRGMFTEEFYRNLHDRWTRKTYGYEHSAEHGRHLIELVLGAYASARRRRPVSLPLDSEDPLYQEGIAAWTDRER